MAIKKELRIEKIIGCFRNLAWNAENDVQDTHEKIDDQSEDVDFLDSPLNESNIKVVMNKVSGNASGGHFSVSKTVRMKVFVIC